MAAGDGFDAAHAGGDAFFGNDAQQAYVARARHMGAAAEFHRETAAHGEHTHPVAVLLAEQGPRAPLQGVVEGQFFHADFRVGADLSIRQRFHLRQLVAAERLRIAEVEAQAVGGDQRAFLFHMIAEHFAQGGVQEVGGGVVQRDVAAPRRVDAGANVVLSLERAGEYAPVVQMLAAALGGVVDLEDRAVLAVDGAAVADLPARLGVERRGVEHDDAGIASGEALHGVAVVEQPDDAGFALGGGVAGERHGRVHAHALFDVGVEAGACAAASALRVHCVVEAALVDAQASFASDIGGHVGGKAVGVVELEDGLSRDLARAFRQVSDGVVQERHAGLERLGEAGLLFGQSALHPARMGVELRVGVAHDVDDGAHQTAEERVLNAELVAVAQTAADDSSQYVAAVFVRGQNAVGD